MCIPMCVHAWTTVLGSDNGYPGTHGGKPVSSIAFKSLGGVVEAVTQKIG